MRSTFKILFFLKRTVTSKDGLSPIIVRITVDGKSAQFNTKINIKSSSWSTHNNRVTGRNSEAYQINEHLDSIQASLTKVYHSLLHKGQHISAEKVKSTFLGQDKKDDTLIKLFTRHNEDVLKMVGVSVVKCTYDKYERAKFRLVEFLRKEYQLSDIPLNDLNLRFIKEYEIFLRTTCSLSNNVAAKMIQYLKKIVTIAFNDGVIDSNPFANFHIKQTKTDIGYLTKEELNTVYTKDIKLERLAQVRDIFIFCCYTGLSYVDVRNLTKKEIITDESGKKWIRTKRQKTKNNVDVPLLDIPLKILDKYKRLISDYLLPTSSNQKMNSYLKELADICGIDKNLTFHQSRHTFATTVTLSNGVPIETVSKMLGHTNIKTTQIYARVTKTKIEEDMFNLQDRLTQVSI